MRYFWHRYKGILAVIGIIVVVTIAFVFGLKAYGLSGVEMESGTYSEDGNRYEYICYYASYEGIMEGAERFSVGMSFKGYECTGVIEDLATYYRSNWRTAERELDKDGHRVSITVTPDGNLTKFVLVDSRQVVPNNQ